VGWILAELEIAVSASTPEHNSFAPYLI